MKKYGLLAEIRRRRKWQQMGQQVHKYENLLNRKFHAEAPNCKWVTDISYIHTRQGVLYLSMIATSTTTVVWPTRPERSRRQIWCWITIRLAIKREKLAARKDKKKAAAELWLHSDQGGQYTSQEYFDLTKKIQHYALDVKEGQSV